MSHKPEALNRDDLVRKVKIEQAYATFTVDDENYQILLADCIAPFSAQWQAPTCRNLEDELRKHGYEGVVSAIHALAHWASGHALQSVVKRLPTAYEPSQSEIRNALQSTIKDVLYLRDKAKDAKARKFYTIRAQLLKKSDADEVVGFRRLCLMTAIAPFDRVYAAEPFPGKPLH